jgi:hypothetical protein
MATNLGERIEEAIQAINAIDDWGGIEVPDHVQDAQLAALSLLMDARKKTDPARLREV